MDFRGNRGQLTHLNSLGNEAKFADDPFETFIKFSEVFQKDVKNVSFEPNIFCSYGTANKEVEYLKKERNSEIQFTIIYDKTIYIILLVSHLPVSVCFNLLRYF